MAKNRPSASRAVSGTEEWAARNVNCAKGCAHGCLYCYARFIGMRYRRTTAEQWLNEVVLERGVTRARHLIAGAIMFPSTHDITPNNLWACEIVLKKLLEVGNRVLVVSKPHLFCIQRLCEVLAPYKSQLLFRFTIGGLEEQLRTFWEPCAPDFRERLTSLRHAHEAGFETSVSAEPLLEPWNVKALVDTVRPFITNSVWIGKANQLRQRTAWKLPPDHPEIVRLLAWQTDEKVLGIYEMFKDDPLMRWKDSYKKVIGIRRPDAAGLDV